MPECNKETCCGLRKHCYTSTHQHPATKAKQLEHTMQIENVVTNVQVPTRKLAIVREASAFDIALDALEIGAGLNYVTGAFDKDGNAVEPNTKAQYSRVASGKWAPKGKTFKVFQAEDQSGVPELQKRYTVARVPFVEPRAKKAKAAAPADNGGEGDGDHAE